jgi:hypothetical protein
MDDLRQEKVQRERLAREKEIAIAEKFTIEQNLSVRIRNFYTYECLFFVLSLDFFLFSMLKIMTPFCRNL